MQNLFHDQRERFIIANQPDQPKPTAAQKADYFNFEEVTGRQVLIHRQNIHLCEGWRLWPMDRKAYSQKYKPTDQQKRKKPTQ